MAAINRAATGVAALVLAAALGLAPSVAFADVVESPAPTPSATSDPSPDTDPARSADPADTGTTETPPPDGSTGSDDSDSSPTQEAEASPPPATLALGDDPYMCAWRIMSNKDIVNVAFPDANATYWVLPYLMDAETRITLEGSFPHARYMSLNTYNSQMDTIDTLRDETITADPGSVNPFQTVVTDPSLPRTWTATVVPVPTGDHARNQIGGVDTPAGLEPQLGFVIIRVYAPASGTGPAGGVALPTVTYHPGAGLPDRTVEPCTEPFDPATATGPAGQALVAAFDQFIANASSASFPGGVAEAKFANPASTTGLFPNGDNKYIATPLSHIPDRILVVRGKAPTFMNTNAGESVAGNPAQLRYWSMCQNDLQTPYPVIDCRADYQTSLDAHGYYTYVVAAAGEVPARAADDPTVTVMDWGSTSVRKVLFMRNMLPSTGFYPNSVQYSQDNGTDPARSMGAYYPQATYCQVSVYQYGGWEACFGNPAGLADSGAEPEAVAAHALLAGASLLLGLGLVLGSRLRARRVRAPRV